MMVKSDAGQEEKVKVEARKPGAPRKAAAKPKKEAAESESKKAEKPVNEKHKPAEKPKEPILALVMVRGLVGTNRDTRSTLVMLRLSRVNHCVLVPKNPNYDGMLQKAKHMITWGEIDRETLEKLVAKRGRFAGDKKVTDGNYAKELAELMLSGKKASEIGLKPIFRLSPPSKGYRSTKIIYPKGSLGYRGEKINELLKRMI